MNFAPLATYGEEPRVKQRDIKTFTREVLDTTVESTKIS